MVDGASFVDAKSYQIEDLWSGEVRNTTEKEFVVSSLECCDHAIYRVTAIK